MKDELRQCDRCDEEVGTLYDVWTFHDTQEEWCEDCLGNTYRHRDSRERHANDTESDFLTNIPEWEEDEYSCCTSCGGTFHDEELRCTEWDDQYCEDCFDNEIGHCEECGRQELYRQMDDDYMCENCSDSRTVRNYSYKPSPIFYHIDKSQVADGKSQLYMGLEVEVERANAGCDPNELAETALHFLSESFAYCKHDGSLDEGFEIVTHPCTYNYFKSVAAENFRKAFEALRSEGARSYNTRTCGMHIHLNASYVGNKAYVKMVEFIHDNHELLTVVSQRDMEQLNRWAKLPDKAFVDRAKQNAGRWSGDRYNALVCTGATFEMRIFRGTLNFQSFVKNVEFAVSLAEFSRTLKRNYIKYLADNVGEYPHVARFIVSAVKSGKLSGPRYDILLTAVSQLNSITSNQ